MTTPNARRGYGRAAASADAGGEVARIPDRTSHGDPLPSTTCAWHQKSDDPMASHGICAECRAIYFPKRRAPRP